VNLRGSFPKVNHLIFGFFKIIETDSVIVLPDVDWYELGLKGI